MDTTRSRAPRDVPPGPDLNAVRIPSDPARTRVSGVAFRVVFGAGIPTSRIGMGAARREAAATAAWLREPIGAGIAGLGARPGAGGPSAGGLSDGLSADWSGGFAGEDDTDTVVFPRARTPLAEEWPAATGVATDSGAWSVTTAAARMPGRPRPVEATPQDHRRPAHHAYRPNRGSELGAVLLPLRLIIGLLLAYAGVSKLTDPVYFNGDARGSLVSWLHEMQPWTLAAPIVHLAIAHPVPAGLGVAFAQLCLGVMTVLGLWQRFFAGLGMLFTVVLLFTVSWRSQPVYDSPDLLYLAAFSPLAVAGASVFSLDSRLGMEAWRTLGPRTPVRLRRRRVLLRGVRTVVLVLGSTLVFGAGVAATHHGPGTRGGAPAVAPTGGGRGGAGPTPDASPSASPSGARHRRHAAPHAARSSHGATATPSTGATATTPAGSAATTTRRTGGGPTRSTSTGAGGGHTPAGQQSRPTSSNQQTSPEASKPRATPTGSASHDSGSVPSGGAPTSGHSSAPTAAAIGGLFG